MNGLKKGGTLLRGISFLLFLALATYVSATLYRQWRHPFLTAPVEEAVLEDACYCRVYLARRENSLTLTGLYGFEAREGEKVAKGATLAGIYDSEAAQVRAACLFAFCGAKITIFLREMKKCQPC